MSDGPYLSDVGVTALAHAGTPVSDAAFAYVRQAIAGEIDALVPYASLVGAHHVLTSVYGFASEDASTLMGRFMDASRVHWYDAMPAEAVRDGFDERDGRTSTGGTGSTRRSLSRKVSRRS